MSDCIFCKIVNGEIPGDRIYEDDRVIAINDINPEAPVHILLMPKKHIRSVMELDSDNTDIVAHIFKIAARLASEKGIAERGFRIVNNCGEEGGQTVDHIHFHLMGGRNMTWPPG